jgi:dipeptidase E
MKLLLASVFKNVADELIKILPEPAQKLTVVFIPTAANVYEDKSFVQLDRYKLVEMGFKIIDFDLRFETKENVAKVLDKADIIFVAGGNTFYLLEQARQSGFLELLPKLVAKGIIYVGSSAGSYLACPTIETAGWKNQDKNVVGLSDLSAANLVPFCLFVHYKFEHREILKQNHAQYPVRILTDEQAIVVLDGESKLVGTGDEIIL